VVRVDGATGSYVKGSQVAEAPAAGSEYVNPKGGAGTWLSVVPAVEPYSGAGEQLTRLVRAVPAPSQVLVGGPSADLVDTEDAISGRIWYAAGWIALTMLVLLFLFTGSLLLPVQAIVLSLFSLTAMFGAMVYVFQHGHMRWLVGDFVTSGTLDTTMPILMFCVAFGLSMDYQVFLLSRIKEEHDATGDNTRAVALGLQRTGPVITAAAGIVAVVFALIGTSSISFVKMFGLGLALAVVIDSTIVRGLLVPAVMRLGGEANWWAPAVLRRAHRKVGLSEADVAEHGSLPATQ
jgi:putative drug exporter of the RND superfamily